MAMKPEFYTMCFMPYIHLPEDHHKYPSIWVELPNSLYDPTKAKSLYERYIDELVMAEQLGFDGISVNEHHGSAYSMMPAPSLIASVLAARTKTVKINVWGTPPNLEFPNRLAEEYAMLDVMSGGRLQVAFPLGTGMEYWVHPVSPVTARERFKESIDIILKCWTEDGPSSYSGEFYHYRYLNAWTRPIQKPHPPCFIVGSGSPETVEYAAQMGWGYTCVFVTHQKQIELFRTLKENAAQHGHDIKPNQLPIGVQVYVADSEKQAREEYEPHIRWFFETGMRTTPRYLAPPGYISAEQLRVRAAMANRMHGGFDWEFQKQAFRLVAGPPDMIANKVGQWMEETGSSVVNFTCHIGDMPHWKTVKNMSLVAEEVLPRLRGKSATDVRVAAE